MDTYRYANVYELDFRLAEDVPDRPGHGHPRGRALQRDQRQHRPATAYQRTGDYAATSGEFVQNQYFNQIIEVQSPRIVRLGLQVNF